MSGALTPWRVLACCGQCWISRLATCLHAQHSHSHPSTSAREAGCSLANQQPQAPSSSSSAALMTSTDARQTTSTARTAGAWPPGVRSMASDAWRAADDDIGPWSSRDQDSSRRAHGRQGRGSKHKGKRGQVHSTHTSHRDESALETSYQGSHHGTSRHGSHGVTSHQRSRHEPQHDPHHHQHHESHQQSHHVTSHQRAGTAGTTDDAAAGGAAGGAAAGGAGAGAAGSAGAARLLTDMRHPALWYPAARALRRTIVCHLGPTNSGKTHAALQALMASPNGVYCGPLRLLACEVCDRLNVSGVPCELVTGQEVRRVEGARHTACTVEMAGVGTDSNGQVYQVAVLDEIQMLGDLGRGWAWTRALLGMRALEVHVCGDPGALPLIERLVGDCGDTLQVHHYERLTPLVVSGSALGCLSALRPGDALVAFSRRGVHGLQREVVRRAPWATPSLVYGALPPDARRHQAAVFNAGRSQCDVLVASDAIGMGLNLSIQRVIFTAMSKWDGRTLRPLHAAEVRQIAGRAGRYRAMHPQDPPATHTTAGGAGGTNGAAPHTPGAAAGTDAGAGDGRTEPHAVAGVTAAASGGDIGDDGGGSEGMLRPKRTRRRVDSTRGGHLWPAPGQGAVDTHTPGAATPSPLSEMRELLEDCLGGGGGRDATGSAHAVPLYPPPPPSSSSSSPGQEHAYPPSTLHPLPSTSSSLRLDPPPGSTSSRGPSAPATPTASGCVTCLHESDLAELHAAMREAPATLQQASLLPRVEDLAEYYSLSGGDDDHDSQAGPTDGDYDRPGNESGGGGGGGGGGDGGQRAALDVVLRRYTEEARLSPHYALADMTQMISIATLLSGSLGDQLSVEELLTFCMAPADAGNATVASALLRYVALYMEDGVVPLEASQVLGRSLAAAVFDAPPRPLGALPCHTSPRSEGALKKMEEAHAVLDLYIWLAYRLPLAFRELDGAQAARTRLAAAITSGLEALSSHHHRHKHHQRKQNKKGHSDHDVDG